MTNWLSTNTLRLARLAHPGREWTIQSDYWATARVERDLSGDVWIGFNADSLDDLARVEAVVCERGLRAEWGAQIWLASGAEQYMMSEDGAPEDTKTMIRRFSTGAAVVARATPDQRRRALIAVMDAHPEIEKQ